jgi:predicted DNA-binding transcriptional regulator YafY
LYEHDVFPGCGPKGGFALPDRAFRSGEKTASIYVILRHIKTMGTSSDKSRLSRLDELTGLLRARDIWTTGDLSSDLGVSNRTLMRDLELLRERGLPIEGERGRGGGVRLHRNWGAGRLALNYQEVLDLLLSLAVMEKMRSPLLLGSLKSIRKKVAQSFPESERKRILGLRHRIWVGEPASRRVQESLQAPNPQGIAAIHRAFFETQKLEMRYEDEKGNRTQRVVEPHILFLNWPAWYLLAWDDWREGARFFRIDRIQEAKVVPDAFRVRKSGDFESLVEQIGNSI